MSEIAGHLEFFQVRICDLVHVGGVNSCSILPTSILNSGRMKNRILFLGIFLLVVLTVISRTPAKGRMMPPPPLSGTNTCSTAVALSGINCTWQTVNSPNELWFSFVAGSATQQLFITQDTTYNAQIRKVEIDSGTCSSLVILDTFSLAQQDSGIISRVVANLTYGRTYYLRLIYHTNTVSSTGLKICQQNYSSSTVCPANGCEIINETFTYNFNNTQWYVSPFGSYGGTNNVTCWFSATNTPQVKGNEAYMWSQWLTAGYGCGNNNVHYGEGIARELPTLNVNKVYVLDYDSRCNPGDTLNTYVALYPVATASLTMQTANMVLLPPHTNIDNPVVVDTIFQTRRICFQIPSATSYTTCHLAFIPWAAHIPCRFHGLYIDNVKLYEINASPTATSIPCAWQLNNNCTLPTGLVSYSWTPSAGLSATNIANPVATPTATTTYTLTMTVNGVTANYNSTCGPVTGTITVNPVTSLTVTPSVTPNPICSGNTATLTATGANSYTWNPGGLTGSTVTVTPGSTTIYTVTGSALTCTNATAAITLTVNPTPTISFSSTSYTTCNYTGPGSTTVCAGEPLTLTASSGGSLTNYTWTPGPLTGSVVTVTPTVTTTYTVNGTGSGCPGSNTVAVTVSACSCSGTALPALTNGTTITGGNYVLNANATVTGTVTLNGTDVKIAPTVSITVPNGAYLRVLGSHLSACYTMWQGIVVDPGGRVDITSNATAHSLIEDAKVAVDNNPTNTVQTGSPSVIQVNGAVFNCNNTAIRRAYYQSTNNANYGTSNLLVTNAVITCRCSIPFPINTSSLTVYSNTVTGTPSLTSPDLSDFYSVQNYTSANLRPPYINTPAYEGVHLENVGVATTQTTSPVDYVNVVGQGSLVLFDNLTYGINAINASLQDTLSAFQNPRVLGAGTKNSPYSGGYAINAINNSASWNNGLYVKQSRFMNWVRGIHSANYRDFNIRGNVIWSNLAYGSGGAFPSGPSYGDHGIYISSTRFNRAYIDSNNMADLNNGIAFSISNTTGYATGNGQYVGDITINNNSLKDVFTGNSYSSRLIGTAISVSNVITPNATNTVTPQSGAGTFINAKTNTISNAWNGIYMSNHQWQKVRTEHNTITSLYQPVASGSAEATQYGIQHANCFYGAGSAGAYGNSIFENTVTGYFASSYTFSTSNQSTFEKKRGIWSRSCGNHYVTCNDVYHTGRGFEWEGIHKANSTFWAKNTMNHNGEGHCLIGNGQISTQSTTPNNANDNQWLSTANTYADTYIDVNSSALNGVLWLQTNFLAFGPVTNLGLGTQYSYGTSLIQPKGVCGYSCSIPPNTRMGNQSSGDLSAREGENIEGADVSYLEGVILDSIQYPTYQSQNSFINKLSVYQMLKRDKSLLSSTLLANFYTSNVNTSFGKLTQIEDSLYTGNVSYASTLLSSVVTANSIEANYVRYYQIYIAANNGQLSQADSNDLATLASSCPMLNGTIVFQARALRNSILKSFYNYEENCPQGNMQKSIAKEGAQLSLKVYPNPTSGVLTIANLSCTDSVVSIEIRDVTGKTVVAKKVRCNNGVAHLNLNLNNGVYFINTLDENQAERRGKMIISK